MYSLVYIEPKIIRDSVQVEEMNISNDESLYIYNYIYYLFI